jgi:tetratricopeptide (TPR) repeat protein
MNAVSLESGPRSVRVFVSSPVDVAPERGRVQATAAKLNREYEGLVHFETVLWEERFYKADRSFQPQIPEAVVCDIVVSVFWTRLGTELPADFPHMPDGKPYPSGTAYELLTALGASKSKGVPDVYVFRKTADAMLPTTDPERRRQAQTQLDALEAFWSEWFRSEKGQFKAAFQTFRSTDEFESGVEHLLRQWLQTHGLLGPRLRWPKEKGSPFPGLAPFEAGQAAVFFGRDRVIDEARRRLAAAAENAMPFLLIVGASGAGKSSLARAGLIPRLTTPGVVTAFDLWRVAIMKPGEGQAGPLGALAAALFAALPELAQGDFSTAAALAENLRRGGTPAVRPIQRALARAAEAEQNRLHSDEAVKPALVLLLDQLEELFTNAVTDDERTAFAQVLKLMLTTAGIWCVATLRADLYHLLLEQPELKAVKEAGATLDLAPPGPAELAHIVRAPAAAAGLLFERDAKKGALDERLLADARTADSLPLLQFTLQQLYEHRREEQDKTWLTHAAYDAIGGLQGAIAAEAERATANLPPGTIDALPRLLRLLAQPARDGKTLTLREAAMSEFTADARETLLVNALIGARILVARQDATGRPVLRLAHDAVLTSWPKAQAAAQASRDFYRVRAEVEEALHRWQEHGQPKDRLLARGVPLAEAEKLITDFADELSPPLVAYVDASRRRARRRQRLVGAAAVFFFILAVGATGAGTWAFHEQRQALRNFGLAGRTAYSVVIEIARGLRNVEGMRAETVRRILDTAKGTFDQLAAAAPDNPALQESRADMFDEFGDTYVSLGDLTRALQADRESLAIRQQLANAEPGDRERQNSLAVSYQNIGDVLLAQGKLPEALGYYRDGFGIVRKLAAADPRDERWQGELAAFQERIGDVLGAEGNLPDALASYGESLAARERLAKSHPEDKSAQHALAVLYDRRGAALQAQGNVAEALASYRHCLAAAEDAAQADPDNADWQRDVAVCHNKIGGILMKQGKPAEALISYRKGLAVAERLAKLDPEKVEWQRDLAVSYGRIADLLVSQGNLTEALASYGKALVIIERLAASDATNAGWQHDLSATYGSIADVLAAEGKMSEALQSYRNGLAIMESLAKAAPANANWQRVLAGFHERIGGVLTADGDLSDAAESYRLALAIRERMAGVDPANATAQHELAADYDRLGDTLLNERAFPDALKFYRSSLATLQHLADAHSGNTGWQWDLSTAYTKIGEVLKEMGELSEALAAYRDGLAIRERLSAATPANLSWRRELAVSYNRVGDMLLAQSQLADALKYYGNGLSVMKRLVDEHPENLGWQRDVSFCYNKVAGVMAAQGNPDDALRTYRDSLAITERLLAANHSNAQWQRDLNFIASRICGLGYKFVLAREFAKALDAADQALALTSDSVWFNLVRAHALMFLGRPDEARAVYLQYRGRKNVVGDKSWDAAVRQNFAELRKAGLSNPLMDQIEQEFSSAG